jgi:hypothetical protein
MSVWPSAAIEAADLIVKHSRQSSPGMAAAAAPCSEHAHPSHGSSADERSDAACMTWKLVRNSQRDAGHGVSWATSMSAAA